MLCDLMWLCGQAFAAMQPACISETQRVCNTLTSDLFVTCLGVS